MGWEELLLDRIYFDSVNGVPGTIWPIGTPQVPSDVIADVITMCAARNLLDIDVHGPLQLLATMEHYCFHGHCHESIADVLDLNGQDVDDSRFDNCLVTGAQGGAEFATFIDCILYNMTGFRGMAERCALYTPLAVSVGVSDFDHCTSIHGILTVTVGAPTRLSFKKFSGGMILTLQTGGAALVRGISGYLEVDEMTGGTLDIYADAAHIQINNDCTGGTINIYGNARVVNNTGGTVVNDYGSSGYAELADTGATTGAAYIDALDIDARLYNEFTIKINNTDGVNSLDFRVLLRPEYGVAEQMIQPEDITLAPADYDFVNIDHKWGQVIVQVRDTVALSNADFSVYVICNKQ